MEWIYGRGIDWKHSRGWEKSEKKEEEEELYHEVDRENNPQDQPVNIVINNKLIISFINKQVTIKYH